MTGTASPATALEPAAPAAPKWLVATFLFALVLPFHPYWLDFEQVRRGLLLLLAGVSLLIVRAQRPVRGEVWVWAFVGCLAASALVQWGVDVCCRDAKTAATFQPWDAVYRIAHWLALLAVLRLGAGARERVAVPLASLLAITSGFGLLQRLGLAEIAGYGVEREPVSVFGNLNVASECTAIAAMAIAVLLPGFRSSRQRGLAIVALVLAGAYLVVAGSRSGMVALPIGLCVLALLRRREHGWLPLAITAAGALLGLLLTLAPRHDPADVKAQRAELQRGTATLDVRWQVARSTAKLWAESAIWGLGPGQFAVHYPRVRSAEEIEISSHGRQFATEVRTAHDDWLELLIDGGLLALVAFAAMLFALQRRQPDKARLLPLFVLLMLMLVRAPLWNAPAAALAFWFAGVPGDGARQAPGWQRWSAIALGLVLSALALPILVANHLGAAWQHDIARAEQPDLGDIATAASWMPFEPRWQEILTREKLAAGDLDGAATAGARAIRLRPHHPQLYLNLGEVLAKGNQFAAAEAIAKQGLSIDPVHPELRVLRSAVLAQQQDADGAIAAVVEHPHPVLRTQLASHFRQLAQLCKARGDSESEARFLIEHQAMAALDGIGNRDAEVLLTTMERIRQLMPAMQRAGRGRDVRAIVLTALHYLDDEKPQEANRLGAPAATFPPLLSWQRELFGAQLDRLRTFDSWQPFFAR